MDKGAFPAERHQVRVAWEEWGLEEAVWGWDVERIPQSIVPEEGRRRGRKGKMRKRITERRGKRFSQLRNSQTLTNPPSQGGQGAPARSSQRTDVSEVN